MVNKHAIKNAGIILTTLLSVAIILFTVSNRKVDDGIGNTVDYDCDIKIGILLSIQSSLGQSVAQSGQLAATHFNEAGGVHGCAVDYVLRDTQGSPAAAVAAASNLVEVHGVEVIMGAMKSDVTFDILQSVTVQNGIMLISCCSSSMRFTDYAERGESKGLWFRTIANIRTEIAAAVKIAENNGYKKIVIINLDEPINKEFSDAFTKGVEAIGSKVVGTILHTLNRQNYTHIIKELSNIEYDSILLYSDVDEGTIIVRELLAAGITDNIMAHVSMRQNKFIRDTGLTKSSRLQGWDYAEQRTPSVQIFNSLYEAKFKRTATTAGIHLTYDAVAIALLAMQEAKDIKGPAVAAAVRRVTEPGGVEIYPGEFKKAIKLLKDGERITYVGATGYILFDENGDVPMPMEIWGVGDNGRIEEKQYISVDDMALLMNKIKPYYESNNE